MKKQSLIELLIGTTDTHYFLMAFFFAMVGVTISLLMHANARETVDQDKQCKFSWQTLLKNNWKRILLSLILIFCCLRFINELFNVQLTMFWALAIGFGWDKLSQILKDKTNILTVSK